MSEASTLNPVALITGATSGLGKAVAERLSAEGYKVYGTGRNPGKDEALSRAGARCPHLIPLDVENQVSVDGAIDFIVKNENRLDLLVACAGMGVAGSVEDCPIEDIEAQMDVNFIGTVRTVRACLPHLRRSRGRIIIIGSLAGRIGIPFQAFYSSSKFALEGFLESLRYELRPFGVQACIVEPGDFKTGFTGSRKKSALNSAAYGAMAAKVIGKQEYDEMHGSLPTRLAEAVSALLKRRKLPLRRSVGPGFQRFAAWLKRIIPASLFEALYVIYYGMR
ncbi:MAG: SDR family NAD(P)-dependent oxidoreductase [Spirochaetes bacterium]|nr:SDR family NAD(P)-dependent oxidoreductase [Spirochaetota bacterium]